MAVAGVVARISDSSKVWQDRAQVTSMHVTLLGLRSTATVGLLASAAIYVTPVSLFIQRSRENQLLGSATDASESKMGRRNELKAEGIGPCTHIEIRQTRSPNVS